MNVRRRPLLWTITAVVPLAALTSQAPAEFEGAGIREWADRARQQPGVAIARLGQGGAASLAILREMLADQNRDVVDVAAQAAAAIGGPGEPLIPALVELLRTSPSWWTKLFSARALGAIGVPDRDAADALFENLCHSDIPHLRQTSAQAFARVEPNAVSRIIAAADQGAFGDRAFAVEALVRCGDAALGQLIAALPPQDGEASLAREALARLGWRAVIALERAGRAPLVAEALRLGAMQRCVASEGFVATWKDHEVAVACLPALQWEVAWRGGTGCELFRAADGARGFEIARVTLDGATDEVRVHTTTMPRDRAFAVSRQLLALPRLQLVARPEGLTSAGSATEHRAAIVARIGNELVLAAEFAGPTTAENVPQRFAADVAVAVLREALEDATWTPRAPNDADREFVVARAAANTAAEPEWSAALKQRLANRLGR